MCEFLTLSLGLSLGSCPFSYYPKLMTIGEFLLHHNGSVQCLHYLPFHPPVTHKQDPKILELPSLGNQSTNREPWPLDFEMPTVIPAASHSAANVSSACQRSSTEEASRATSSAKYRRNLEGPKLDTLLALGAPRHHVHKKKSTIRDRGQPRRNPTPTEKTPLDFIPRV